MHRTHSNKRQSVYQAWLVHFSSAFHLHPRNAGLADATLADATLAVADADAVLLCMHFVATRTPIRLVVRLVVT